jgi:UDP:flavonoid glycosyltransferase YjiC (YdhE family)
VSLKKRIAIAVIGTQGDVQPFVALALTLKRRGYSPVLGTSGDFEEFVTSYGIEFFNLGGDVQAFLRQSQFDSAMTKSAILYAPALLRDGQKILKEASRRAWEMAQHADALIFQNNTTFCIDIAEALGVPALMAVFQPLNPTSEFPYFEFGLDPVDPLLYRFNREPFSKSPSFDPMINKLSYAVQKVQQTYWDMPRDRLRRSLGLKPKKKGGFYTTSRGEPLVTLHAYSAAISPAPGDWQPNNIITGHWRLEDNSGWEPSPDFRAFLDAGEPPVYLGFGSMPFGAQRNTDIIVRALKMWGGRAVIGKGWGGVRPELLPDSVFLIERAPHTKLFEHVKAVVHHGGAGTTHTGLYAGLPSFAVPQFFDQPYWGRLLYELGVGPRPVRIRKITPQVLASALDDLASTPSYTDAAAAIGAKLKLEDGTNLAVDVIEETIAEHGTAGPRDTQLLGASL